MIKMIPPGLDKSVRSNAERKVFDLISKSELNGYCFHSVGLALHEYKSYAEADYIVVTERGVLCLEVKGGQVSCEKGVWTFIDRFGNPTTKREGPFDQAVGAMHSVKASLSGLGEINFACGVIFPDIEFESQSVSAIPEVQMDLSNSDDFAEYLMGCHSYWNDKTGRWASSLTEEEIENIREQIRGDLNYVPLLGMYSENAEKELIRLTVEQSEILKIAKNNDRILVSGPAGSGKTLLGMEFARLKAREGNRVLFLTYNKLLASFLRENNTDANIKIRHFHGLISEYCSPDPRSRNPEYYNEEWPGEFLKYLSSRDLVGYDLLVLDEGQDLLREAFLNCFDKLLKSSMTYGKWAVFYDANQSIFVDNFNSCLKRLQKRHPTELELTKNCRNVKPIAVFNNYLSGIDTGEPIVDGEPINLIDCDDNNDAIAKLNSTVQFLIDQGFSNDDIVLISPVRFDKSIANNPGICFPISNDDLKGEGIRYFPIQSFKGLESNVVIFVDYSYFINKGDTQLLYTSLSRSKTLLYLFADKKTIDFVTSKVFDLLVKT